MKRTTYLSELEGIVLAPMTDGEVEASAEFVEENELIADGFAALMSDVAHCHGQSVFHLAFLVEEMLDHGHDPEEFERYSGIYADIAMAHMHANELKELGDSEEADVILSNAIELALEEAVSLEKELTHV